MRFPSCISPAPTTTLWRRNNHSYHHHPHNHYKKPATKSQRLVDGLKSRCLYLCRGCANPTSSTTTISSPVETENVPPPPTEQQQRRSSSSGVAVAVPLYASTTNTTTTSRGSLCDPSLSTVMEGTLSKWTNVVHGWQYRFFVLSDDVLAYYTSREKMLRRQQRGCIRLKGATIGIDGENNSQFTINVDGKVFHLQGREQADRDTWVRALERAIHEKSGYYKPPDEDPIVELEQRVNHAEKQLADILEQVRRFEQHAEQSSRRRKTVFDVIHSVKRLQSTVDHSIIILQQVERDLKRDGEAKGSEAEVVEAEEEGDKEEEEDIVVDSIVPPITYSSSSEDEDEFFDATSGGGLFSDEEDGMGRKRSSSSPVSPKTSSSAKSTSTSPSSQNTEPDWGDENEDFDQIYKNNEESELGDVQQQHGSVLMHLLSQVSVGMDLTKVTLPTFILERRSLLEMYADFFAHPDDFILGTRRDSAEERFISVVRYYLSAFYPARKSGVAKKPYNPILGETFRCRWTVPEIAQTGEATKSGPFPGSDLSQVTFVAEQVSHHPPVSAFYAEHPGARVSLDAHIWTKSSFLGLSIGVANIGHAVVTLHDYDEKYVVTFPSGYGRSIMSTPWVELGGKVFITCEQTGYNAEIEFLTKPFFGGKPHKIDGRIYKQGLKKPILTLRGEWNNVIYAKNLHGDEYLFVDVKAKPEQPKECEPVAKQGDRESRRLWRHVTAALFHNQINTASAAKRWIEQRQRDEAKTRAETGEPYQSELFDKTEDGWKYKYAFGERKPL